MSSNTFSLHRWNRDFSWRPVTASPRALNPDQTDAFNNQGFFVIEDLLDSVTMAAVVKEIDAIESQTEESLRAFEDERLMIGEAGAITFSPHLVARSNLLRQVAADPRIASICVDLIGPDVNLYWDQAVYKKPEKPRRFPWHQDNGYTYVNPSSTSQSGWRSATPRSTTVVRGLHPGFIARARWPTATSIRLVLSASSSLKPPNPLRYRREELWCSLRSPRI